MFEKVNCQHPDKVADRIAGAIVDLAYSKQENPKVAVEVLIGHNLCTIINETSCHIETDEILKIVKRISESDDIELRYLEVPQDEHLAKNQEELRCGDNGVFKGVPTNAEEKELTRLVKDLYSKCKYDGKYIINGDEIIACQSHMKENPMPEKITTFNPLGYWTGGINVDSGATNRKLGSDMGRAVTGGGMCLSGDSEFLSSDLKWYKISEYKEGQKVAEWDNGKLHFVTPIKYIHNKNDEFLHIYNDTKLSMKLTPYHQVLLKTSKGNLIKHNAYEVAEKLEQGKGDYGKIIHNFTYERNIENSSYADEAEYRLQVAFCADGTILNQVKWNGRIRVKKENKKARLRELLKGKEYKETKDGEFSIFWYKFTKKSKSLRECFENEKWDILKEEVFYWDGSYSLKLFRTTKKDDADFIQLVFASYGFVSTILTSDKIGQENKKNDKTYYRKSIDYTVHLLKSTTTGVRENKGTKIKVKHCEREDSYCFEVPTHNLIIRHNDRIFITGNCGKDYSKADVSVNIYCHLLAEELQEEVQAYCSIGAKTVYITGKGWYGYKPYEEIVKTAKIYIESLGGFEKFAEWGLIR